MRVLTFDLECKQDPTIKGWKDYEAMGISFGCLHADWLDDPFTVFDDSGSGLSLAVEAMAEADLITGFNIIGFDWPLLFAVYRQACGAPLLDTLRASLLAKSYDVLADIRHSTRQPFIKGWNLNNTAKHNCKAQKSGDGADAPGLFIDGKHDELKAYVTQDVVVERELFEVARDQKFLVNPDAKIQRIELVQVHKWFPAKEKVTA